MEDKDYLSVRNRTVTKANELIQKSRFSLSLQQQKIMLYLISQVSPYDEEFKLYTFSITEFCKVCGIDEKSGKNYSALKRAVKEIRDKSIWVKLPDGRETTLSWIEKINIDPGSGTIAVRLDNDMKPFLLQLKSNFTSYELIWTLHFKSKYTIRLYELIKSIHFHELENYTKTYTVDELKGLLNAEKYRTYQDFKKRVLLPSIEEINTYSDKIVEYEVIKKGRAVDRIKFSIESRESIKAAEIRSKVEKEMGLPTGQVTFWDEYTARGYVGLRDEK